MTPASDSYRWIGIGLVALAVVLGTWWSLYDGGASSVMDKWTTAAARQEAAREIIADQRLIGMTQDNVVSLLGRPDKRFDASARWTYGWSLGQRKSSGSMMFAYEEYLVIQVRKGMVSGAAITNAD